MFEKKWQFSADVIRRGFDIIEVSDDTQFLDGNIALLTEPVSDKFILRASACGHPKICSEQHSGTTYKTITVGDKTYIPQR